MTGLFHLAIMSSRFIRVVACIRIFFILRLNNIPLYVYITFCLSICLIMDTQSASTFWTIVNTLLLTWVYKYLFKSLLTFFGYVQEEEQLDHTVVLFLNFGSKAMLFSIVAAPFYLSTGSVQSPNFYMSSSILANFHFLILNILTS